MMHLFSAPRVSRFLFACGENDAYPLFTIHHIPKMILFPLICFCSAVFAFADSGPTAFSQETPRQEQLFELTVIAEGVRSENGAVIMELSNAEGEAVSGAKVSIRDGESRWVFTEVPAGKWAVRLFHDENNNEKLDTNFLGIPREGYGFSNNPPARFGPPPFNARLFEVQADTTIRITLIY